MPRIIADNGGGILRRELFTTSGTWTKPADIIGEQVWVTLIGGGGSGASSVDGGGGNGGQVIDGFTVDVSGVSSASVTVGFGGASVNGGGANTAGNSGSPSSFGAFISALGAAAQGASFATQINSNISGGTMGGNPVPGYLGGALGRFGAPGLYGEGDARRHHGGAGLIVDDSGVRGGDGNGDQLGGYGYGAGGGASDSNSASSGAGADGVVVVEYLEKA